jgi:hypothetical protein
MEAAMSKHLYYYLNRPPGIGCQPDGWTETETWMPAQPIPGQETRHALGWVKYPEPLDHLRAWRFDLHPADPVELAHYAFWMAGDMDEAEAQYMEADYLDSSEEELQQLVLRGDYLAAHALVLKEAARS